MIFSSIQSRMLRYFLRSAPASLPITICLMIIFGPGLVPLFAEIFMLFFVFLISCMLDIGLYIYEYRNTSLGKEEDIAMFIALAIILITLSSLAPSFFIFIAKPL